MKYASVVLVNQKNPYGSVEFLPVTDALLTGGVFLDETCLLPYDAPASVSSALVRLFSECDGVFLICDRALLSSARSAVSSAAGVPFEDDVFLEAGNCLIAVLPAGTSGAELVLGSVIPRVDARRGNSYRREYLRTVGVPGEKLRDALAHAEEVAAGKLILHASEKYGVGRIEMIYDRSTPKMTADEVMRVLATELSEYTYSLRDESIAERLVDALRLHRLKLSTAESFTGGGVGRAIVRVAGASDVFYEGLNTYSPAAKTDRLGVNEYTLRGKGVVSDDTAYEMAAGLLAQGNCDVAISTTGYAGPAAEGSSDPVGLCYLAVGTRERVRVFRYRLAGDRETITETAIFLALFLAYREIK